MMNKELYTSIYSKSEERVNVITHLLGLILSFIGTAYLLYLSSFQNDLKQSLSYFIYGLSGIILYLMSTLYHAVSHDKVKKILKICDHCAIYVFIAGCYTPFIIINLANSKAYIFLSSVWALAFLGVIFKLFFTGRFNVISTFIYLAMGWLVVTLGKDLGQYLSTQTITWLIVGGLSYSLGTIFYLREKMPYHHGIWHIFVLLGSLFHYIAILSASIF